MRNRTPDIACNGNNRNLIAETIRFWNDHAGIDMTEEDAREAIENLSGFFKLLQRWDLEGQKANQEK